MFKIKDTLQIRHNNVKMETNSKQTTFIKEAMAGKGTLLHKKVNFQSKSVQMTP